MENLKRHSASLVFCLLVLSGAATALKAQTVQPGGEVLTNEHVITMLRGGLSSTIVVSKIRSSKTNFNLSTEELLRLKNQSVPDEVVSAMFESSTAWSASAPRSGTGDAPPIDPNDPLGPHEAGVYLMQVSGEKKEMVQLEPSVYTQTKSGGLLKNALTYGMAKIRSKAVLPGANAKLQIISARPVFYFYFEVKTSGLSGSNNVYSASTSPNEFVLVKLEEKKRSRELVVGQRNVFGAQSGTLDKDSRPFDYEKLAPGVYKVTPRQDLTRGEYGIFYGGSVPIAPVEQNPFFPTQTFGHLGAPGGSKVFDFGIKLPQ
jgi:hypothetical protein